MAFKLTKKEAAEMQKLVDAYDVARSELSQVLIDLADEWESECGDESEKWQESDAGEAARERIDTVTGWADEIPEDCPVMVEDFAVDGRDGQAFPMTEDEGIERAAAALAWAARPVLTNGPLSQPADAAGWWQLQSEMDRRLYLYRARVAVDAWERYWEVREQANAL